MLAFMFFQPVAALTSLRAPISVSTILGSLATLCSLRLFLRKLDMMIRTHWTTFHILSRTAVTSTKTAKPVSDMPQF